MNNTVRLTGKVKNIVERDLGQTKIVTATLNHYDMKTGRIAVTIGLVGYEGQGAALLRALIPSQENEPVITVEGELDTLFDRRSNVNQSERRSPWTRISVSAVERV